MTCWLNGKLCENPLMDATGAGALLGWGIFTTLGIRNSQPLLFHRHYTRLQRDAEAARITFTWREKELSEGLNALLAANSIEQGIARITLLRRDDGRWNTMPGSELLILAQTSPPSPTTGLHVVISPHQYSPKRPLAGVKTTSYLPYLLEWQAARDAGYDEALLLTDEEVLCEGARTSLFWAQDQVLYTPALDTGCLAGVGREWVKASAQAQGLVVREGAFPLQRLLDAEETFLISAATGPRPIASITSAHSQPQREFNASGPLTRQLMAAWQML